MKLRLALASFLAGCVAVTLQAPGGLDWTQAPLADAWHRAVFAAAVLVLFAAVLRVTSALDERGKLVGMVLLCTSLGVVARTFGAPWLAPESRLGFGATFLGSTLVLGALLWSRAERRPEERRTLAPRRLESLGWGVAGAGAALALAGLSRRGLQLTHGLPEEHGVVLAVVLLLAALGARAFGTPLLGRCPRLGATTTLALVPAAALGGLVFLATLDQRGLEAYLARFGLTTNACGMLEGDALLAATTFVLPAFALGAALAFAAQVRALPAVLLGAAVARLAFPFLVGATTERIAAGELAGSPVTWAWLARGAALAVVGVAVATFAASERLPRRSALTTVGLALVAAAPTWFGPRPAAWLFSPWYLAPLEPEVVFEGALGTATVEWSPGGRTVATLDRRCLTPTLEEESADRDLLAASLALLPEGEARVLLVGQLTPDRDDLLRTRPDLLVDRTAPWFDVMDELEDELFAGARRPPAGERVDPREARRRIADGTYALVLVLPIRGPLLRPRGASNVPWGAPPAPVFASLDLPEGTRGVVWTDVTTATASRVGGDGVLLAGGDWRHLRLGRLVGERPTDELSFDLGEPRRDLAPWRRLTTLPRLVGDRVAERNLERLRDAAPADGRVRHAVDALHRFFAVQGLSSPFETPADQVELEVESLQLLYKATAAEGPTPFLRASWSWLAWLVTEKRRADLALPFLEPLAESFGPWPELDLALAHAYREFDMPAEETAAFARALEGRELDVQLWVDGARAAERAGHFDVAAARYRRALELQPRPELERALGLALLRQGELEGRALLEAWLEASPEDEEVRQALEAGVFPEIERGYAPLGGLGEGV